MKNVSFLGRIKTLCPNFHYFRQMFLINTLKIIAWAPVFCLTSAYVFSSLGMLSFGIFSFFRILRKVLLMNSKTVLYVRIGDLHSADPELRRILRWVTRWVCEKITQSVAQPIFITIYRQHIHRKGATCPWRMSQCWISRCRRVTVLNVTTWRHVTVPNVTTWRIATSRTDKLLMLYSAE
jgi:hypothetical protein